MLHASGLKLNVIRLETRAPEQLIPQVAADALIVQWATIERQVLEAMPRCKVISRYGIGVDLIDLGAAAVASSSAALPGPSIPFDTAVPLSWVPSGPRAGEQLRMHGSKVLANCCSFFAVRAKTNNKKKKSTAARTIWSTA